MRKLLKKDLVIPSTLINEFTDIRNMLAGHAKGMTLDHKLADQVINLLLCKMYDERSSNESKVMDFQVFSGESYEELLIRINNLFEKIKEQKNVIGLLDENDNIDIDGETLEKVIKKLQHFDITNAKRDIIGEAFESFVGPALRGNSGQFFTPRNVAKMLCDMIEIKEGDIVLDPACGTGGFLTQVIKNNNNIKIIGIDKDKFLAKICGLQVSLLSENINGKAYCEDTLSQYTYWNKNLSDDIKPNNVDVIITNPPFGTKITVLKEFINQFDLGHDWKKDKKTGQWVQQDKIIENRPPQILFIERCIELLKPGGRMGIVLPDGIFGNQKEEYIRQYILKYCEIISIVDLPLETFLPSTSTKTSVLFLKKKDFTKESDEIFMAIAEKCGHDRRGNSIYKENGELDDDLPIIAQKFNEWRRLNGSSFQYK